MRFIAQVLIVWGAFLLSAQAAEAYAPTFAKGAEGIWTVAGDGYTAAIAKDGYLTSFKVGTVETIGAPFVYQPNAKLIADQSEAKGDTLTVHLKGNGEATIDYRFRRDGLTIIPTWRSGGYGEFRLTFSAGLLGIELLNDKSATIGGDSTHFVENGEIRGVPAVGSSRNQMLRFHFPGFGLHAYVQAWGAPFNYESAGSIQDRSWGRPLLEANRPFPILLTIQRQPKAFSLPTVVFVPRSEQVCSLYYPDQPCTWNLDLGEKKRYQYLLDAGVTKLDCSWRLTDIHDQEVGNGKDVITLDPAAATTVKPVELKVPGTGYYQVRFTLSEDTGKMPPSGFQTRFAVIHQVPGMTNRDDTLKGKGLSDYAAVAMIGIGGIRESHNIGEYFSDQAQSGPEWVKVEGAEVWMNVKRLDEVMDRGKTESEKYHLTWFFQANSRPNYATPASYEAMAFAFVSRGKDRCRVWEVENEPNFGYSPEDYVNKCLIPFAKGAKRADPTCAVMGPDGCGVRDTMRFMEKIYAMKANTWLDIVSTHSYPGPGESWEQFGNLAMLQELRRWMEANSDGKKQLWQTEQGYTWDGQPKAQAARYVVRQFLQGQRETITFPHQYYFYPQWGGFESWYQIGGGEQGSEHSWLPIAAAQRFLAENTFGMTYAGEVPSPYKGIFLSRYIGQKEDVIVAWTFDFACAIPLRAEVASAVGYMGQTLKLEKGQDGNWLLNLSGEPIYLHLAKGAPATVPVAFGPNLALASAGAVASASSSAADRPAALANDGNWNLWEDAPGMAGRTSWTSAQRDPSQQKPDWLQITFPCPRTINRLMALSYLPAVNPSPRDWIFQIDVGGQWKTVAEGKNEFIWCLHREIAPVTTAKIRLQVTGINDGWHGDRHWMHVLMGPEATNYTASQLMISELEAYGPPTQVEVLASVKTPEKTAYFAKEQVTVTVTNRTGPPRQAQLLLSVPEGWRATPAQLPVAIGHQGAAVTATFELAAPPVIAAGAIPVDIKLVDEKGAILDFNRLNLQVAAPVEVSPQTPQTLNQTKQPLSASIRNTGAQPVSGVMKAIITGKGLAKGGMTLTQAFGPIAAKAEARVEVVAENLRLGGSTTHVVYEAVVDNLAVTKAQELTLREWQAIGPFPNQGGAGFDAVYEPERTVDFTKECPVPGQKEGVRWKSLTNEPSGLVDFGKAFQPNNNVCAYAVAYVKSPTARPARLSVGSDDGVKCWVNGKQMISNNCFRGAAPGQEQVPVELKAGWNEIKLKITQGGGGWGFFCDLQSPDGAPLDDLEWAAKKP